MDVVIGEVLHGSYDGENHGMEVGAALVTTTSELGTLKAVFGGRVLRVAT